MLFRSVVSLLSLFPAFALVIFGLPRRRQMLLSTTGGHKLSLSTGIPQELTNLLYAVGRKQRFKDTSSEWRWDLPLFDDEEVRTEASIGLIQRKSQVIGLFALILFIDSLDQFVTIILHPSFSNLIIFMLKILDLIFIWFALVFAKKYRRIIATSHRLLFQEEMIEVSGLWGKRIYSYRDSPYDFIKGFTYSNFSALQYDAVLGLLILMVALSSSVGNQKLNEITILFIFSGVCSGSVYFRSVYFRFPDLLNRFVKTGIQRPVSSGNTTSKGFFSLFLNTREKRESIFAEKSSSVR